jgi:hypothetical protein
MAVAGSVGHRAYEGPSPVHPDTPAAQESVQTVISRYRKAFEQESVLWKRPGVRRVVSSGLDRVR